MNFFLIARVNKATEVFISHNKILVKEVQDSKICQRTSSETSPRMPFKAGEPSFSIHPSPLSSSFHSFILARALISLSQRVNLADSNIRSLVDTSLGRALAESRRLLVVVVGALVFLADVLDRLGAGLGNSGGVAVVAVDADEVLAVGGLDVVDGDFSGAAANH